MYRMKGKWYREIWKRIWSVAVGCGFLFGIHWGWGLVGMWCAFVLDENLRGIIFVQRWNSLKWTKKGFVK